MKTVFVQESQQGAREQWRTVADSLRERYTGFADLMDTGKEDVLACMAFAKEHLPQIHSTNPLERLNEEIKRRTNVVGIFVNEAAIIRLVGARLLEQKDEWALTRRYSAMESLARIVDNPGLTLPGVQFTITEAARRLLKDQRRARYERRAQIACLFPSWNKLTAAARAAC